MRTIKKVADTQTKYYRGDEVIEITPFDNYYIFTIYHEANTSTVNEMIPLNVTGIGDIYLVFFNGSNEIRIKQYTEYSGVDYANGEVAFRIDKDTAQNIIANARPEFYITSKMSDENTSSDETVIFTGNWVDYASGMSNILTNTVDSLTNDYANLQETYSSAILSHNLEVESLNSEIQALKNKISALTLENTQLKEQLSNYNNISYIEANILSTTEEKSPNVTPARTLLEKTDKTMLEYDAAKLQRTTLKSKFD